MVQQLVLQLKLTNVANGTVAANSKDAVNGGQLFDVKTTADAANTAVTTKGINSMVIQVQL